MESRKADNRSTRPWTGVSVWRFCSLMVGCSVVVGLVLTGVVFLFEPEIAWAQPNPAVVTGAARVFVRRGPGKEFPPFGSLPQGTKVEVQEMDGEWARVTTTGGQVGYINSTFLALPEEKGEAQSAPAAAAPVPQPLAPAPASPPVARLDSAELRSLTERNKALEAELQRTQEDLAALKTRSEVAAVPPTAVPVPTAAAPADRLQGDVVRLTAAIDTLQHRLSAGEVHDPGAAATNSSIDGTPHVVSSTALLLGASGLLLGWLLGSAYGRSQERGRRSRIRF